MISPFNPEKFFNVVQRKLWSLDTSVVDRNGVPVLQVGRKDMGTEIEAFIKNDELHVNGETSLVVPMAKVVARDKAQWDYVAAVIKEQLRNQVSLVTGGANMLRKIAQELTGKEAAGAGEVLKAKKFIKALVDLGVEPEKIKTAMGRAGFSKIEINLAFIF